MRPRCGDIRRQMGGGKEPAPSTTLGLMGGSCLVSDLEAITYAADLCNRHEADTIEAGSAVAMAMEYVLNTDQAYA